MNGMDPEWMTAKQTADAWGISVRRVRMLCAGGRIGGAEETNGGWRIPAGADRPADGRRLRYSGIPGALAPLLKEVEALKEERSRLRPLTQGELERMRDAFLVDYTHASTAIEGNTLTLKETALVLEGMTIGQKPLKCHLEAIGHRDAFRYLEELVSGGQSIDERMVKELHALVLADKPEDRGVYRRIPVYIRGAEHVPPQPYMVAPLMEQWVRDVKRSKKHPIAVAAESHLGFESIHPFIDGNGRTGRLLLNFVLMRAGYLPVSVKYENRLAYYGAFAAYGREGKTEPMVKILLEAERDRMQEWLRIAKG